MTPIHYRDAWQQVSVQRCGFGDDQRGYCGVPAVEHVWVHADEHTMTCGEHAAWFAAHPPKDHHPVVGTCGLPNTRWLMSSPAGGPGWCDGEDVDWLAALESEAVAVDAR